MGKVKKWLLGSSFLLFIAFFVFAPQSHAATEVIVDNTDAEFTADSAWPVSTTIGGYYGANYAHDGTNGADTGKWARWTPDIITAGYYKIYMRWTEDPSRPAAAPLEIKYADGLDTLKTVNQRVNGGEWNAIGTYYLHAGTNNYVQISASSPGYTIADAVKFEYTHNENAFFHDIGIISNLNHALPAIIAVDGEIVTIGAQIRYTTTVPGGHHEKGAADIVTFRSTDKGDTWESMNYIYEASDVYGDSGYSSVFVKDGDDLLNVYTVGPQDWSSDELVVYQKTSTDGGDTWSSAITPTIINDHANAKPSNGGQGYQHTNGRLIIPGRVSLLYSDNGGSTWTATPQFAGHIETKVQPMYVNGEMSDTALVPWRTQNANNGTIERIEIADDYSHLSTHHHSFGANNNFGFVRYDESTLLMTITKDSNSGSRLYIRKSVDEGLTWTNEKDITGSAPSARYSDIAVMPDGTIVVVFMQNNLSVSNGAPLRVVKFNMDWLMQ